MSDLVDMIESDDEEWAAFERLGRRAGAELRMPPPEDGVADVPALARRRTVQRDVVGAVIILLVIVAGWFVLRQRDDRRPPVDRGPLPSGAPGTWRRLPEPPVRVEPSLSTWTGTDVLALGYRNMDASGLTLLAYDVRRNIWRTAATPPAAVRDVVDIAWTGSELLAIGSKGQIASYEPTTDRWRSRAVAPGSLTFPDNLWSVAASAKGALVRSGTEWWWYDEAHDRWSQVASPGTRFDTGTTSGTNPARSRVSLERFGANSLIAFSTDSTTVVYSVFDPARRAWAPQHSFDSPRTVRGPGSCQVADERIVCYAEGFRYLSGEVIDVAAGTTKTFELVHNGSTLVVHGTPWFAHAWSLLLARTATWEPLPPLDGVGGFGSGVWDGKELLLFEASTGSDTPATQWAAAYTPKELP